MNLNNLDKTIRQLMRKRNTPGMAIGIIKDGETLYSKGFGCRNLKQQLPMTSDTLIGIGSITKSITAFAITWIQIRSASQFKLLVQPYVRPLNHLAF